MKELKISVVMPTYNRVTGLSRVLNALMDQSLSFEQYEVIVVDNNSTDGTKEFLEKYCCEHKNVQYVFEGKQGAAAARNVGVRSALSDLILFLDDDMVADRGLLEGHVKAHRDFEGSVLGYFSTGWENLFNPSVVTFKSPQPTSPLAGENKLACLSDQDLFLQYLEKSGTQNCFPFEDESIVGYRYFYTGNVSVRKSVFEKVGGFDEGYTVYGMEDIDLGFRLEQMGEKMIFCRAAESVHDYHPTFGDYLKKQKMLGKSFRYFFEKFPQLKKEFRFMKFPFVGFWLLKWLFVIVHPLTYLLPKRLNFLWYGYFHWKLRYEKKKAYLFG